MSKSKSGVIRKSIGPVRTRLMGHIDTANRTFVSLTFSADLINCQAQADDIQELSNKIRSCVTTLESKDDQWQALILELSGDELSAEEELYSNVGLETTDGFMVIVEQAKELLCRLDRKHVEATRYLQQQQSDSGGARKCADSGGSKKINAKLPKLALPSFSGDYLAWSNFWNIFKANVHEQPLTPSEKFAYLRGQLSGNALKAIDGIVIEDSNYDVAVSVLRERFERTSNQLVGAFYGQLKRLPTSSNRVADLPSTYDSCEKIFRQLEAAGEDTNANRSMVLELFSKYPSSVIKDLMERHDVGTQSTVGEIRKALQKHSKQSENLAEIFEELDCFAETKSKPKLPPSGKANGTGESGTTSTHHSPSQTSAFAVASKPSSPGRDSTAQPQNPCYFCNGSHFNSRCEKFPTAAKRADRLRVLGRCSRCLSTSHAETECRTPGARVRCFFCKSAGSHVSPLCEQEFREATGSGQAGHRAGVGSSDKASPNSTLLNVGEQALLLTASTTVFDPNSDKQMNVRLLFDSGSHRSYITESCADRLSLSTVLHEPLRVSIFGTKRTLSVASRQVQLDIRQRDGTLRRIRAHTTPLITSCHISPCQLPEDDKVALRAMKETLADDIDSCGAGSIDLLIGSDYFWEFLSGVRTLTPSGLFLIPSTLGCLLAGRYGEVDDRSIPIASSPTLLCLTETFSQRPPEPALVCSRSHLGSQYPDVDEFWSIEGIGITDDPVVNDDDIALRQFNESVSFSEGRYHVTWPWKANKAQLPTNYVLAAGRFKSLAKRLVSGDPEVLKKYDDVISDQISKNVIERVPESSERSKHQVHYLPHHPVIKPSSTTTKVRIVYDASAKTRKDSPSLNECLYRGPVLLPDLCKMLIRFRLRPIAIVADVEKAFLQMCLQESERDVTRFLWFKNVGDSATEGNMETYRSCRVPFGVISSPFLLAATIQYHLRQQQSWVAEVVASNIYVDNVIVGVDDLDAAESVYLEAKRIFASANMNLQQWCSNSQPLVDSIPEHDRTAQRVNKVLGLEWDRVNDTIRLQNNFKLDAGTKRQVLHAIASVYDPLGLFQPVLLQAKLFLQRLWEFKKAWDDEIDEIEALEWRRICGDVVPLFDVVVPRSPRPTCRVDETTIVAFCDASAVAYAACVYVRSRRADTEPWSTTLAYAKTRLAPRKKQDGSSITLPRLELLALTIGTRAAGFVREALCRGNEVQMYVFSDSMCVLHWLHSPKPLFVFVHNRVQEIKKLTCTDFLYVNTA